MARSRFFRATGITGWISRRTRGASKTYADLEKNGYDQVPTASSWSTPDNFKATVEFCRRHIDKSRLKGFLQTPWLATVERDRERHMQTVDIVSEVIRAERKAG